MRVQQSSKDKVLWALGSSGGKISISRLRKHTELTKAELDDIFDELEREDKIIMGAGRRKIVLPPS
jgi:uncharacterized protein